MKSFLVYTFATVLLWPTTTSVTFLLFANCKKGFCTPKRLYGESCHSHKQCKADLNLVCINEVCGCNATEAIYDTQYSQCAGKAGASCKKYSRCVKNANLHGCGRGAYDVCRCDSNQDDSKDDLCLAKYNTSCNPLSSPCQDEWHCINGKCECHFPSLQFYDLERKKCISRVNGPCLETIQDKSTRYECEGVSECRDDKGTGVHECLCKKGFIKSVDGLCRKRHGSSCKEDNECDFVPGARLVCKEGFCSCGDFQSYDEQLERCVGLVGAKCNECGDCRTNSYCKMERDDPANGFCRCIGGAKAESNRKCVLDFFN